MKQFLKRVARFTELGLAQGLRKEIERLRNEVAIRDTAIQTLCYRYKIMNHEHAGWSRAEVFAKQVIDSARRGTIDTVNVPPSVRLNAALTKAYYDQVGRISMAHQNNKPFPNQVFEDADKAAAVVVANTALVEALARESSELLDPRLTIGQTMKRVRR